MKFLIAVFLQASPFINFGDFCRPPRLLHTSHLLFSPKFASLPIYSALPFYLKLESTKNPSKQIQPTLEDIMGLEQTAAIKGNNIIENLYLNQDLTSYANANKIQTAMMALDNEKIFDKVDWQFLKALQNFGYGLEIIKKIKTVYQTNKPRSR